MKNSLGSEHKRLNDFVEAAESLALMTKNNPNSSGTATTNFVLGMIFNPVMLFKAVVGSTPAYQLLTNKRFLNLATRYAKEPTPALSNQISNIFQQETGMSIQTANKIMHEKKEE